MQEESALLAIESRYRSLSVLMDERMRRQWAAAESRAYGWGGVRAVGSVIGMSPNTIRKGFVLILHLLRYVTLKLRGRPGTRACVRILPVTHRAGFHRDSRPCR